MTRPRHRLAGVSRAHPVHRHARVVATKLSTPVPASFLALVAPHLPPALEEINVPAYVIDSSGRIRWLNAAAKAIVGDAVGKLFTSVIDPDDARRARSQFAQNLRGEGSGGEFSVDLLTATGEERTVEISSVPLRSRHQAIGMFGLARPRREARERPARLDGRLTVRQHEILEHLAEGESTEQIAAELHLSRETVRNHVRHILRRLGTSSRLEAVAVARREEIL